MLAPVAMIRGRITGRWGNARKAGTVLSDAKGQEPAAWRLEAGETPGVFVFGGEIDFSVTPKVRERLLELLEGSKGDVVLDLADLAYIDSSGLALLIELRKQMQEKGRTVRIRSISPQVGKLLHLTQLGEMFGLPDQD